MSPIWYGTTNIAWNPIEKFLFETTRWGIKRTTLWTNWIKWTDIFCKFVCEWSSDGQWCGDYLLPLVWSLHQTCDHMVNKLHQYWHQHHHLPGPVDVVGWCCRLSSPQVTHMVVMTIPLLWDFKFRTCNWDQASRQVRVKVANNCGWNVPNTQFWIKTLKLNFDLLRFVWYWLSKYQSLVPSVAPTVSWSIGISKKIS